jgi:hypothetical protein
VRQLSVLLLLRMTPIRRCYKMFADHSSNYSVNLLMYAKSPQWASKNKFRNRLLCQRLSIILMLLDPS